MIEFCNVGKTFPDGTVAISDFSLVISSHSTVVLVGSSGCGKTTLLRMVNAMVSPSSGSVHIDHVDVASLDPVQLRRSIGYVMQQSGLLPHKTVVENIGTVLSLQGISKNEVAERARNMMTTVGLDSSLAERYPRQLSGGQQQRVGVARALVTDPNILLMDEPFGAVDPIVRDELQAELLELQTQLAKTIVFVTHDIDEAFLLGDQIVIMEGAGNIAQHGSAEEILAQPASDFVRDFVGLNQGKRRLRIKESNGQSIVVDTRGRATGVLE